MYGPELARIHDQGFRGFAEAAGHWLAQELRTGGSSDGTVVDLGCGSGVLLEILAHAGFGGYGVDLSPAMVELARARVPGAVFEVGSCYEASIPPAVAVVATGEVLGYLDGAGDHGPRRSRLFAAVHRALRPGGVFVFDLLERRGAAGPALEGLRGWESEEWTVHAETRLVEEGRVLERRIRWEMRGDAQEEPRTETHRVELLVPQGLVRELRELGFDARRATSYGDWTLPGPRSVVMARKAARSPHPRRS